MTQSYSSPSLHVENDCEKNQEDLQDLEMWKTDWLMEFHPDKCSVIRIIRKKKIHIYLYTLRGQILAEETNTKYLKVTIADKIMWNQEPHLQDSAHTNF